jgi:hypothetical protein
LFACIVETNPHCEVEKNQTITQRMMREAYS